MVAGPNNNNDRQSPPNSAEAAYKNASRTEDQRARDAAAAAINAAITNANEMLNKDLARVVEYVKQGITPAIIQTLQQGKNETREAHTTRVEEYIKQVSTYLHPLNSNYAKAFEGLPITNFNRDEYNAEMKASFSREKDEIVSKAIHGVIQYNDPLDVQKAPTPKSDKQLEVERKIKALEESKGCFNKIFKGGPGGTHQQAKDIDVDQWIKHAYNIASADERAQFDQLKANTSVSSLKNLKSTMALAFAAHVGVIIGTFALAPTLSLSVFTCVAVSAGAAGINYLAQWWMKTKYENQIGLKIDAVQKQLESTNSMPAAMMWAGLLFKNLRDGNPLHLLPNRAELTNNTSATKLDYILDALVKSSKFGFEKTEEWAEKQRNIIQSKEPENALEIEAKGRIIDQFSTPVKDAMNSFIARWKSVPIACEAVSMWTVAPSALCLGWYFI